MNTTSHAFGFRPGIDLDKLNQLADELEAEAYAANQGPQRGFTQDHPSSHKPHGIRLRLPGDPC
jgi:hypothetical protein